MKFFQLLLELKVLSKGFTLIELVTTIAIFILVLSISISSLDFYKAQIIKAELSKLEMNINFMQKLSELKKEKLILSFNSDGYLLTSRPNGFEQHKLNSNVKFGFIPNSYGPPSALKATADKSNPLLRQNYAERAKPITKACSFENNQIIFEPNGNISSGVIYFCDSAKKVMYALSTAVAKKQIVRKYRYSLASHKATPGAAKGEWKLI